MERGKVLPNQRVSKGQIVINISTLEVQYVDWKGYPSLGIVDGYDVVQILAWVVDNWVKIVPVFSAPSFELTQKEILFEGDINTLSLLQIVKLLRP